ncbi:MAG TPA: DNA topoisomerase IB [Mycobacteriales bacterium]|nr:DNA topoisomerase IB [Mycobacteriales bacterium]
MSVAGEVHDDPEESARFAGLHHVDANAPGISRRRAGKGFTYRHPSGRSISKADRARIDALVIPPAWTDVWICTDPKGHLQATGVDDAGRKQYLYHARWRAARDLLNFYRLVDVAKALPGIRRHVDAQLRRRTLDRDRVVAGVIALLDRCHARIGGEEYAEDNESYGLTTLRPEHVRVRGATIELCFPGKSGKEWSCSTEDAALARLLRSLQRRADDHLFALDGTPISADEVNACLARLSRDHLTAKDFRTWGGTLAAFRHLRGLANGDPCDADVVAAVDAAAELLGNTRAVARSSYVHPEVLAAHLDADARLRAPARASKGLSAEENALVAFLRALLDAAPVKAA